MNNDQFRKYIEDKLKAIEADLDSRDDNGLSATDVSQLKQHHEMLQSALKIMTYGTGPERRRFRRDYERRLTR